MSLREKAREVKAAGEAERGNFTPRGVPLDIYNFWAANAVNKVPEKENFCHFWRVIALWAPLAWLRVKVGEPLVSNNIALSIGSGLLVVLALVLSFMMPTVGWALVSTVIGTLAISSFFVGLFLAVEQGEAWNTKTERNIMYSVALGGILGLIPMSIAFVGRRIPRGVGKALDKYGPPVFFGAAGLGILGATFLGFGWWALLIDPLFIGIVGGGVFGALTLNDYLEGLRVTKHDRAQQARYHAIEDGTYVAPVSRPNLFVRFFGGLRDFLVLFAQVVRVHKWKICPLVEIDNQEVNDAVNI